ncbi:prolyl oligopeptidase family serine peptidase [Paludisphaera borealis]|uniref:Alpha/beta hydrolase: peptidase or carbohydrate esterase n=1 Tax=Paludisphaera borealis TaxID=1387353 RepID=A0A1U7CJU6_9BACT|nr:prolyl oligopeptidase family serine peptidase [Paludisphaera borealis]APW59178.1 alpha/beta hydrolase: peptidase or carbohydrate esterase [Paludisphaera borealis]
MDIAGRCRILVTIFAALTAGPAVAADAEGPLGAEERQQIESGLRDASARLATLKRDAADHSKGEPDRIADAELFAKGVAWALKYDASFSTADRGILKSAVDRFRSRVNALEAGESPWAGRKGKVVRGFVSAVDGSVQPYAVVVPTRYDRTRPARLDVVLHGSSKPVGMSELHFIARFDEGDGPASGALERDYIELHPLGRVENGYRWAGETDVFEAIEAVCRNYNVDRDRIVLRGMSMGASGTWHLGLKHPDRFVALGPYCGYVDTYEFSKTPLSNFVKVGPLPPDQEKMLHMLDSVDYAANAGVVPTVACIGDKDVFFQAHEIMSRAMAKEGLAMVNLISPGTGHVIDPVTHKEQMRRIGEFATKGLDHAPGRIRFVTWTLKYSRCHWVQVLGMEEHYARAELEARVEMEGAVVVVEPKNVTRFAIRSPVAATVRTVRIEDEVVSLPGRPVERDRSAIVVGKRAGRWAFLGDLDILKLDGKQPGLQGPIDDAFTTPFLCVRGTGTAWDPAVQTWAEASLKRFSHEWSRYFRGALPIKDDTAVTAEDARRYNLILFGDPGSNSWIARVLPRLPVRWTREECAIGDAKVPAAGHALMLIQPNPLADGRYVVFNSGHTFHEKELASLNYLLFPRLGDWAVVKTPDDPSRPEAESVVRGGFFDEAWAAPVR